MEQVSDAEDMDVHPAVDDNVKPPPAKVSKNEFKDFSLNTKQLFTGFSDEEKNQALIGEPLPTEITNGNINNNNDNENAGDPLLVFYLYATERKYSEEDVLTARKLLSASWNKDQNKTFETIKKIRDWKEGKGLRQLYQICLYWLYQYHPNFLNDKFEMLFRHTGYYKDSLEFLMVIAFNGFVPHFLGEDDVGGVPDHVTRKRRSKTSDETNIYNIRVLQYLNLPLNEALDSEKRTQFARIRFENDVKYRFFHVQVAKFFAKGLLEDKNKLEQRPQLGLDRGFVSYFSKWAPGLEKHHDKYTLIASTVACELLKLAGEQYFYVWTKSLPVAVYLARTKVYNKDFCVPLRSYSKIAEVDMSAKRWYRVKYSRVPAKAMKRNAGSFEKNDSERFGDFLESDPISTQELKPLEIIDKVMSTTLEDSENYRKLLQRQWKGLVWNTKCADPIKSSISVIRIKSEHDSGSRMLKAALGLMILISDINPFGRSSAISLNEPEIKFNEVQKSLSIFEKIAKLKKVSWEGSATIFGILEKILERDGKEKRLNPDQMVKLLFFFVDDDFNSIFPNASEDIKKAKALFEPSPYLFPTLVFWNLKSMEPQQVSLNSEGVFLLSGAGAGQVKSLMGKTDVSKMSPLEFLFHSLHCSTNGSTN